MKLWTFAILIGTFTGISSGQGTHELWAEEAGRLDSGKIHVAFTVVAFEDPTHTDRQIRGLRLGVSAPEGTQTVFVPEATLQPLKEKLDGLARATRYWSGRNPGNLMISSVCPGEQGKLPLSFGYHYGNTAEPELSLSGPGLPGVVLVGPTPSQLLDIFVKAIEELKLQSGVTCRRFPIVTGMEKRPSKSERTRSEDGYAATEASNCRTKSGQHPEGLLVH